MSIIYSVFFRWRLCVWNSFVVFFTRILKYHFLPKVLGKQLIFQGLAEYFQSSVCKANKEIGEEIARLQVRRWLEVIAVLDYT